MHVGIAGEVRCVVTKADGKVKTDTGFQKNLILNQGLDFFGGGKGASINTSCAIGSGNSTPAVTQTKLDTFIALKSGEATTSDYSYVDKGDNLYRMWEQKKYRFTDLDNVNISELGLVSTGTTSTNYYLTTRILIKDSSGAPTSISVKTGETLDIYYKVHKVLDIGDKEFVIDMLDGNGGSVPYKVVVRPSRVGDSLSNSVSANAAILGMSSGHYPKFYLSDGELVKANGAYPLTKETLDSSNVIENPYLGDYKKNITLSIPLASGNFGGVRLVSAYAQSDSASGRAITSFFPFQIRYGSVANDSPIPKTANDTLSIPVEFSWGRYEGTL